MSAPFQTGMPLAVWHFQVSFMFSWLMFFHLSQAGVHPIHAGSDILPIQVSARTPALVLPAAVFSTDDLGKHCAWLPSATEYTADIFFHLG